jgi:molybdopterin converting factor small subunit
MAEIIIPGGGGAEEPEKNQGGEPKSQIHVDSDWKAQAQAEKDRLEQEAEAKTQEGQGGPGGIPPASFQALWTELASQAYVFLGAIPDPKTGQAVVAPEYAKYYIDLLGVLEEKTKGNLTEEEGDEFGKVLSELRQVFVRVSGYVSEEMKKREAAEAGGGGEAGPADQTKNE